MSWLDVLCGVGQSLLGLSCAGSDGNLGPAATEELCWNGCYDRSWNLGVAPSTSNPVVAKAETRSITAQMILFKVPKLAT